MAVFKCKMCAGTLEINDGNNVATCEYCGMKQTLPKLNDDRRATLYDRAGHFRRSNEYDKAMAIYETILNEDSTDAEAYWSIVLCKYGVEYVEDPATHRRIPTCNRTQFKSILADEDYKQALENAEGIARNLYEEEAQTIDAIQKGILEISNKEEPFDVFICYKETGTDSSRTKDSVLAHDVYQHLIKEGYKVFFARITLESKLGHQYEPYIFAALNSAKVMLVVGTKPEYFNAVWVKNEWSRYLALTKENRAKMLIPCYRDMDVYDLPDELSMLQSQDMGKLGFMQDLLHGVKKIMGTEKTDTNAKTSAVQTATSATPVTAPGVESLMKRGWLFLEDGEWKQANEYFDRVLDIDPEYAPAYIGKLCSEVNVHSETDLPHSTITTTSTIMEDAPDEKMKEIVNFMKAGEKIKAIIVQRERTGMGLKEAKEFIDAFDYKTFSFEQKERTISETKAVNLSTQGNFTKAFRFSSGDYREKLEQYSRLNKEHLIGDGIAQGYKLLSTSKWEQANEQFDKALDTDAEYAPAYIGKLCVELKLTSEDKLGQYTNKPLGNHSNFTKALRFAQEDYKATLDGYNDEAQKLTEQRKQEEEEDRLRREEEQRQLEEKQRLEAEQRKRQEQQRQQEEEQKRREFEAQSKRWQEQGLCRFCGGQIGGLFSKKCKSCGKA